MSNINIKQSPEYQYGYQHGYYDRYKEGYNKAIELYLNYKQSYIEPICIVVKDSKDFVQELIKKE